MRAGLLNATTLFTVISDMDIMRANPVVGCDAIQFPRLTWEFVHSVCEYWVGRSALVEGLSFFHLYREVRYPGWILDFSIVPTQDICGRFYACTAPSTAFEERGLDSSGWWPVLSGLRCCGRGCGD